MSVPSRILSKLIAPFVPASKDAKKSASKTTAYRYTVNLSPRATDTWLTRVSMMLRRRKSRPKHERDTAFAAYLTQTEVNDPVLVLWLNEAKSRQMDRA